MRDLLSTASCVITTSTTSGDGTYIDNDSLSSMATTTATYLSMNSNHVMIIQAQDYVNSMSIEQLVEFDQRLDALETTFEIVEENDEQNEAPKIYTKTM